MSKSKVKIELNQQGLQALLKSKEIEIMLKKRADEAVERCGEGYRAASYTMPTRAVARVSAVTRKAKRDNLQNNTILKSLK